jgi:hypothetical protein
MDAEMFKDINRGTAHIRFSNKSPEWVSGLRILTALDLLSEL